MIMPSIQKKQRKALVTDKLLAFGCGTCGANQILELIRRKIADLDYVVACTTLEDLYTFYDKLQIVVEEKNFPVKLASETEYIEVPEAEPIKISEPENDAKLGNISILKGKERVPKITLILLGPNSTKGEGAGSKPEKGKKAAEESTDIINKAIAEYDLVFVSAGMGKGTGTGVAPYVAKLVKENNSKKEGGSLAISIVAKCYSDEGPNTQKLADEGIANLLVHSDLVAVVQNDKIEKVCSNDGYFDAFSKHNDVLASGIISVVTLLKNKKERSADLSDVRTAFENAGYGLIARGNSSSSNENANIEALEIALHSPWLDNYKIRKNSFVLLHLEIPDGYNNPNCEREILKEIQNITGYTSEIKTAITKLPPGEDFYVTIFSPAEIIDDNPEQKGTQNSIEKINITPISLANNENANGKKNLKLIAADDEKDKRKTNKTNKDDASIFKIFGDEVSMSNPNKEVASKDWKPYNSLSNTELKNIEDTPTFVRNSNNDFVPNRIEMEQIQQFTNNLLFNNFSSNTAIISELSRG